MKYLDNQLTGWRASAGLSMPLEGSRSNSNLHFGVEYGHRSLSDANGMVLDNTLEESIFNIQVGVSLAPFFKKPLAYAKTIRLIKRKKMKFIKRNLHFQF